MGTAFQAEGTAKEKGWSQPRNLGFYSERQKKTLEQPGRQTGKLLGGGDGVWPWVVRVNGARELDSRSISKTEPTKSPGGWSRSES